MNRTSGIDSELNALAARLVARRKQLLQAWKTAVEADPELTSPSALPRRQFYDHIPDILDAYERRLRAWPGAETTQAKEERREDAAAHGLQRWQQGYELREVAREWGHLHLCIADEIDRHEAESRPHDPAGIAVARRSLIQLINEGLGESADQYFRLRQLEAEGNARDVEQALQQLRALELKRAELWRQAAHDLRGNLGVVSNVTNVLTLEGVPLQSRDQYLALLQRSVSSLHAMLGDVMNLAKLQAGHETREVREYDAAAMLTELCETYRPMAKERGLWLEIEGPPSLRVEGDEIKTRRIAQNLLLNALRYTQIGGMTVSWGDSRAGDAERWMLCVRDSGPGFHAGPGAPLAGAMEAATEEAKLVQERDTGSHSASPATGGDGAPPASDARDVHQERGEGIGLSIVKRLCELLDAAIELDSTPNVGTTFRVVFPRRYNSEAVGSQRTSA
jgi:signal transduction histidine kinase